MDSASENHVQCAGVAADTTGRACVEELDIFGLVEEEVEVFRLVVDMCRDDGVRQADAYSLFEFDERDATGDIVVLLGVFAIDGDGRRHRLSGYLLFPVWHVRKNRPQSYYFFLTYANKSPFCLKIGLFSGLFLVGVLSGAGHGVVHAMCFGQLWRGIARAVRRLGNASKRVREGLAYVTVMLR